MGRNPTRRTVLSTLGLAAGGVAAGAGTVSGGRDDCPGAAPLASPRPGPDLLYDDPATPPQFDLDGAWTADPLWVCGHAGYDDGEFLSQGWPFDDRGANGERSYPDEDRYANNAADVLEIRARPTEAGVAYRIALNTMVEPDAAVVAIGIDEGDATDTDWGHGLGDLGAPVDHVLVTWGTGAVLDSDTDASVESSVSLDRNVIEVEVSLDPGRTEWRHYAVSGLYDGDEGFRDVGGPVDVSDAPPVFNVGFRTEADEPLSAWRDQRQAAALRDRDISELGADVDFARLRDGDVDRSFDQRGRFFNRIYGSRYELGPGIQLGDPQEIYRTRVQAYSIYVPSSYEPGEPTSFVVLLHGLGQNHNRFANFATKLPEQLGEQRDAIVLMPHGRGPEGWWKNEAELDVFEGWSDVASRYTLDVDRVTISGYSMGGHGTYRLSSLYPDLFARAFPIVGPPDQDILGGPMAGYSPRGETPVASGSAASDQNMMRVTDNLRHVPMLLWAAVPDELVPYPGVRNYRREIDAHGYRHRLDSFPTTEHIAFGRVIDEWGPGREFLGDATVERRPARVTYRAVPSYGNDDYDLSHDGAYWVHDIELADDATGSLTAVEGFDDAVDGLVDATALTDGYGEPVAERIVDAAVEPIPNSQEGRWWVGRADGVPPRNAIELTLEEVVGVTLYVDEVDVDTTEPLVLEVDSTHAAAVTLQSGAGTETVRVPAGRSTREVVLCDRGPGGRSENRSRRSEDTPDRSPGPGAEQSGDSRQASATEAGLDDTADGPGQTAVQSGTVGTGRPGTDDTAADTAGSTETIRSPETDD